VGKGNTSKGGVGGRGKKRKLTKAARRRKKKKDRNLPMPRKFATEKGCMEKLAKKSRAFRIGAGTCQGIGGEKTHGSI